MLKGFQRYAIFAAILVVFAVARVHAETAERVMLLNADTLFTVDPVAVTAVKHEQNLNKSAVTATVVDFSTI